MKEEMSHLLITQRPSEKRFFFNAFRGGASFRSVAARWPPRGTSRQEAFDLPAPSLSTSRVSFLLSRAFARSGNGKIRGAIRYRQLQPLTIPAYRSFVRRLFNAEDTNSPRTFSDPRGAFTEPCRPLTLSLSLLGTPESVSVPPDPLAPRHAPLRDDDAKAFDPRA
jgi:hypothetical protein